MSSGTGPEPSGHRPLSHRLNEMAAQLSELSATGRSADGCATVTVGANGQLVDLVLDPAAVRRMDPSTVAHRIMEAARVAGAQARTAARDVMAEHLPAGLRPVVDAAGPADFGRLFNAGIDQLTSIGTRR